MQIVENVVIAAAGMGKRLGKGIPKTLVKVNDKMICEYQLDLLKDVKNVFMVVGFCEDEVMDTVRKIRKDIIFVRNPDYRHTKTLESYYMASKLIKGKAIYMDGDMILSPTDFFKFMNTCISYDVFVGISKRISDDPVYAFINDNKQVVSFSYEGKSNYEWANLLYIDSNKLSSGKENVFEYISRYLPINYEVVDRLEVDTPEDLQMSENVLRECVFINRHDEVKNV